MNARSNRRGLSLIWTVLFMSVMIALAGLACDTGLVLLVTQQLQATADASALAGARALIANEESARLAAQNIGIANRAGGVNVQLDLNEFNDPNGDIIIGNYDETTESFDPEGEPNAVRVIARRTAESLNDSLGLVFGPVYEVENVDIARDAIAYVGGGTGAGLIVLDPTANCSLLVQGTGELVIDGGDIQVNSSNSCAACTNGGPIVQAPNTNVVGNACFGNNANVQTDVNPGVQPLPDPLAGLQAPAPDVANPKYASGSTDLEIWPGYYPEGIVRTGGNLFCHPGTYYIDGTGNNCNQNQGLRITGGNITALNCTFYIAKGKVDFTGNSTFNITPPQGGTYDHVSFFQSRTNTCQAEFNGGANMVIQGTLYFPENHVILNGTGDGLNLQQLIADTLTIGGTGSVTINYDGYFPSTGSTVYLVK